MVLGIHSNAGYLNENKARIRAGGHFFMSSDVQNSHNNGAVLTIAQIIDAVMSSAAEAELGAPKKQSTCDGNCRKWGTLSLELPSKQITRPQRG